MSGMVQQQSYRSPQYQPSNSSASGPTPLSPRQNGQQRAKEERKLSASDYNNHRGAPQQQFKSERRISLSGMEEEKLKSHNNKGKTSPIEGKVRTRSGKKYGKPPVSPSDLHDFLRSFVLSNVSQNLSGTGTSEGNLCCKADLPSAADVSLDSWCDGPLRSPKDTSPLATSETIFKRLSPSELFSTVSAGRRTKEENRTPVKIEVVSHSNSLVHTCSEECSRQPQTPTSPTSLQGVTKQDLLSAYFELLLKQKQQSELSIQNSRNEERRHAAPVRNEAVSSANTVVSPHSQRHTSDPSRRGDMTNSTKCKLDTPVKEGHSESPKATPELQVVHNNNNSRIPTQPHLDCLKLDTKVVLSTATTSPTVSSTVVPGTQQVFDSKNVLVYQNKVTAENSCLQSPSILVTGSVSPSKNPIPVNPASAAFFRPVSDMRLQPRFQHNNQPVMLPAAMPHGNHHHHMGERFLFVSPHGGFQMFHQAPQPQFLMHNPHLGAPIGVPALYPFIVTNGHMGAPMHNPYHNNCGHTPMSAYGASIQTTRNLNGTKMVDVILPSHPGVMAELTIFKTETVTSSMNSPTVGDKQSFKDELSVDSEVARSFCGTPSEKSEVESMEDAISSINDSVETLSVSRVASVSSSKAPSLASSSLGVSSSGVERDCQNSAASPGAASTNLSLEDSDCACSDSGYMSESNSVVGMPPAMRFQSPPPLREFCLAHPWDNLSQQIWRHYIDNRQSDDLYHRKLKLKELMYTILSKAYPECGLFIIGSSLTGFGSSSSDMDVCLMLSRDVDQRFHAAQILDHVGSIFKEQDMIGDAQLIHAKVPILRMRFNDPQFSDIRVDLNTNNPVSIKNTHMMFYYATWDWRVKPLVLVVKQWAQYWDINDASRSTLSSYSLVLMVIHYLQCGTPGSPVLPSLQKLYPKKFSSKNDIKDLNVNEILDPPASVMFFSSNFNSLADLFVGFLDYYAFRFNFDEDVICIRNGSKVSRSSVARADLPYSFLSQWRCICIEEPFNHSNTARAIYDEFRFEHVRNVFVRSYKLLAKYNSLAILFQHGAKNNHNNNTGGVVNPRSQYVAQK